MARRVWPWFALLVLSTTAAPSSRAADPEVTVENIRVGFNNLYKLGQWTPVSVDLKAGAQRFTGALELVVPDDDGTPTSVYRVVDIPARETLSFPIYVRVGGRDTEFRAQVRRGDAGGRVVARAVGQQVYNQLEAAQRLILTLGAPRGVDEVPKLPGFSNADRPTATLAVVSAIQPTALPGAWYGYDGVDAIVIDTNAREVMRDLPQRAEGLRGWVRNGGHLVLAVGTNWQEVNDSPLHDLMPALPTARVALRDLGAIEAFAGAENKPLTGPDDPPTQITKLELVPARGAKGLDATSTGPILVRGHYGFGRVTVVGLDVDTKPFADWPMKAQFWSRVLDLKSAESHATANPTAAFAQGAVGDLATLLHSNLEAFEGVKLVPFGWVAFFVFIYILLIGPGDYFFLKKVVKRMELTWITFPLIVATVSLLAYAAAYAVKGTELKLNKVDLVDLDQADGLVRGATWFTLFSPQNRDYRIGIDPLAIDRDPAAGSPGQPNAIEAEKLVSWFGTAESNFGGSAGSGRMGGIGGSGYEYVSINRKDGQVSPYGLPEAIAGVRVPIWSTKSVYGRWHTNSPLAAVEAALEPSGAERLGGTVTNRLSAPLKNAILAYGKTVYLLGDLAPGEVKPLAAATDRVLGKYLNEIGNALPKVNAWQLASQPVELNRADVVRVMLFASSTSGQPGSIGSDLHRSLDLYPQLALDRPILVANLEGPDKGPFAAAAADLGELASAPKISQTTVLRVILPTPPARP